MSELVDARNEIAQVLKDAGITAFPFLPERLAPPMAEVSAGAPYITPGGPFGEFKAHWQVRIVAGTATNVVATDALDELIEDAIVALVNSKYSIEQVDEPQGYQVNNAVYPSADIKIYKTVRI